MTAGDDHEQQAEAYRQALHDSGLAARMTPERIDQQVAGVRRSLAERADVVETREVVREGRFRKVEHVTISGESRSMEMIEPVRDADGLIDVEASVLNTRLVREATAPDLPDVPPPSMSSRLVMALVRWRMRKQLADLPPPGADAAQLIARVNGQMDAFDREAFQRAREEERRRR